MCVLIIFKLWCLCYNVCQCEFQILKRCLFKRFFCDFLCSNHRSGILVWYFCFLMSLVWKGVLWYYSWIEVMQWFWEQYRLLSQNLFLIYVVDFFQFYGRHSILRELGSVSPYGVLSITGVLLSKFMKRGPFKKWC